MRESDDRSLMVEGASSLDAPGGENYLIFTISDILYGFPSRFIGEVAIFDAVYPLPLLPEYMPGIINRYSTPYALIDVGLLLGRGATLRSKVLVLKEGVERAAFLIDDVLDMVDVAEGELLRVEQDAGGADRADVIAASFSWNKQDVLALDVRRILERAAREAGS
jgi:purine-binding chemotaxis protein CheW